MSIRPTTKHDIQRDEENITRPGFDVVTNLLVSGSISMSSTGVDQGTGQAVLFSPTDGWTVSNGTWSCISTDSPIFNVSVTSMVTGSIEVGDRVWLNQSSQNKYFLVHGVGVTGSTSYLTLYGGTDFSLVTGSAISSPYYSHSKSPFGFPTSPAKWTVTATDANDRTQTNPVAGTWYNLGSFSISVPIGAWVLSYIAVTYADRVAASTINAFTTLSTANNLESNTAYTRDWYIASNTGQTQPLHIDGYILSLTTKTTYYLNAKTSVTGITNLIFYGASVGITTITLVDAYL